MPRTGLVASTTTATAAAAAVTLLGWCAALLAVSGSCALAAPAPAAFPRPATPDDFLGLLLWAQAAGERATSAPVDPLPAAVDYLAEDPAPTAATTTTTAAAPTPASAPAEEARQLAAQWRDKHRALFRKNDAGVAAPPKKTPPTVKKHAPAPKTASPPPPPPPPTTAVPAPALWAPEEAVSRAAMPALEEYDRSERFGHSFVHGFRPF